MGRKKSMDKYMDKMEEFKQKCECGHSIYLSKAYPIVKCNWCGRMNYFDKKEKFKNKMLNELYKEKMK